MEPCFVARDECQKSEAGLPEMTTGLAARLQTPISQLVHADV